MPITLPDLKDWTFSIDFEGIAWAVIDRQGESMNALGRRATEELEKIVTAIEGAGAGEVKGLARVPSLAVGGVPAVATLLGGGEVYPI